VPYLMTVDIGCGYGGEINISFFVWAAG
jgi:hypothetical protein